MRKKIIALVLAWVMLFSCLPADVLAAQQEKEQESAEVEKEKTEEKSETETNYITEGDKVYVILPDGTKQLYSDSGNGEAAVSAYSEDYEIWDTFEFGEYPKSRVTDSSEVEELEKLEEPASGYYRYEGEKYAKSGSNWYLVEPLVWRIIYNYGNGTLLIVSDQVIDSKPYNESAQNVTWESSSVRSWLNGDFYKTAFGGLSTGSILTTAVDNSAGSSLFSYDQPNTEDKVFLLSYGDLINESYNFNTNPQYDDPQRRATSTEYAQSKGTASGYCNWWTRSTNGSQVQYVLASDGCVGTCHSPASANSTGYGIRPAMVVSDDIVTSVAKGSLLDSCMLTFYNLTRHSNKQVLGEKLKEIPLTVNGEESKTSETASYELGKKELSDEKITITMEGYYDYIFYTDVVNKNQMSVYMNPMTEPDKPYISTVYYRADDGGGKWKNGAAEETSVVQGKSSTYTIKMCAQWRGHGEGTYVLSQDEEHKLTSENGIFQNVDIAATFQPGKTIYAYCIGGDKTFSQAYETQISVQSEADLLNELAQKGEFSFFSDGLTYTIPESIDVIGGAEIGLDLPSFPLTIDVEGNKVKAALGINLFKNGSSTEEKAKEREDYNFFKENLKKLNMIQQWNDTKDKWKESKTYYNRLNTLRKNHNGGQLNTITGRIMGDGGVDLNLYGYIEFEVLDGQVIVTDSFGCLMGEASYSWTQLYLVLGFPIYAEVSIGIESQFGGGVTRILPDNTVPLEWNITIKFDPYISGEVGAGLPKFLSVGLNMKGDADISYEFLDSHLNIDLGLALKLKAQAFLLKAEKEFARTTWNIVSQTLARNGTNALMEEGGLEIPNLYDESLYNTLADRDYAAYTSWNGGGISLMAAEEDEVSLSQVDILMANCYDGMEPQMIRCGDTLMLIWLNDNTSRASQDRTELVYSLYDSGSGTWSEPAAVSDDGTADFYPSFAVSGDRIYIAWQNTKTSLAEIPEDSVTMDNYTANGEICTAVFDTQTGTMSEAVILTENDTLDTMPVLADTGDGVQIVWMNNSSNSIFGGEGTNSIWRSIETEDGFGEAEELLADVGAIHSWDAVYADDTLYIAYAEDQDKNFDDMTDTNIMQAAVSSDGSVSVSQISDNEYVNVKPKYIMIGGIYRLLWSSQGNIFATEGLGASGGQPLFEDNIVVNDTFSVASDGGDTAYIVWPGTEEDHVELYASVYENGKFSNPVPITKENQKLLTPSAVLDGSGNLIAAVNYVSQREATEEEQADGFKYIDDSSNLAVVKLNSNRNIAVSDEEAAIAEYEITAGGTTQISAKVTNTGTESVNGLAAYINGSHVQDYDIQLEPGAETVIDVPYTFPETISPNTELNIQILPAEGGDMNESDNSFSLTYGEANLTISEYSLGDLGNSQAINFVVANNGYGNSPAFIVRIYEDPLKSDEIYSVGCDSLPSMGYQSFNFTVDKEDIAYDENGIKRYYVEITEDGEETSDTYEVMAFSKDTLTGVETSILEASTQGNTAKVKVAVNNHDLSEKQGYITVEAKNQAGKLAGQYKEFIGLGQEYKDFDLEFTLTESQNLEYTVSFEGSDKLFDFTVTDNGEAVINNYYGNSGEIILPDAVNGYPITALADGAFINHNEIKSITLPEGITEIADNAFYGCNTIQTIRFSGENERYGVENGILYDNADKKLMFATGETGESVEIPDDITAILSHAFSAGNKVKSIHIGSGVKTIGDYAFNNCTSLETINIPDNVENLGSYAFLFCSSLKTAQLGKNVQKVPEGLFRECTSLETIKIGENINAIGKDAFYNTPSLKEIQFDSTRITDLKTYQEIFYKSGSQTEGIDLKIGDQVEKIPAYLFSSSGDYSVKLKSIQLGNNVTEIGDGAFYGCNNLTEISLPKRIKKIGDNAFYNCSQVTYLKIETDTLQYGQNAFYGLGNSTTGTEVEFGDDVKEIPNNLFENSSNKILTVTLPKNLEKIGSSAFSGCSSLETVYTNGAQAAVGDYAFYKCSRLKEIDLSRMTEIGIRAFYECSGLQELDVSCAEKIGDYAFYRCSGVNKVQFGDGLKEIGEYAFYGVNVKELSFPDTLEIIGDYAFSSCTGITALALPDSLRILGSNAFSYCNSLESMDLGEYSGEIDGSIWIGCSNLKTITGAGGYSLEDGVIYRNDGKTLIGFIGSLEDTLVIPESVEIIGENAFYGCSGVKSIKMADKVHTIGDGAFYNCSSLTSLELSRGTKNIGRNAFYGCSNLGKITIPDSVMIIGDMAFYNCSKATDISLGSAVREIGSSAFYNCTQITELTIPESVKNIGNSAFYNAYLLSEIHMNAIHCNDLGGSGNQVFYRAGYTNKNLSVTFGDNVEYIPGNLFYSTSSSSSKPYIVQVTAPKGKHEIGGYAFAFLSTFDQYDFSMTTGIGPYAFFENTALTEAEFSDELQFIEERAFYNCTALSAIDTKNGASIIGDYAFYGCSQAASIRVGDSVRELGAYTFGSCTAVQKIYIGRNLVGIGERPFNYCTGVTELEYNAVRMTDLSYENSKQMFYRLGYSSGSVRVVFGDNVEYIPAYLFYNSSSNGNRIVSVDLGNHAESIGTYAFYNSDQLTEVTGGTAVTRVGDSGFRDCGSIKAMTGLEKLENIENYAFQSCSALTSFRFSENLAEIGDYAFSGCSALQEINLGDNVRSIGIYGFSNCSGATTLSLGKNIREIGRDAFYYCSGIKNLNYNIAELADLTGTTDDRIFYRLGYSGGGIEAVIGDDVKKIPDYLFYPATSSSSYQSRLVSVDIGNNVTEIGDYAFYYCTYLQKVTGAESVKHIGERTFYGDSALQNFSFSPSVQNIGEYAFGNCAALEEEIQLPGLLNIGSFAFSGCQKLKAFDTGDKLEKISKNAFAGCTAMTSLRIGESVKEISNYAFYNNTNIQEFTFDAVHCQDLTENSYVFYAMGRYSGGFTLTIGDKVEYIPAYFMQYSSNNYQPRVSVVVFGKSVESIGAYAFSLNQYLNSVKLNSGLKAIGEYAFYNTSALQSLSVPATVQSIGEKATRFEKSFTLYCYKDSEAHRYAQENNMNYELVDEVQPTGVVISNKPEEALYAGENYVLHEAVTPDNIFPAVTWKSSDESVAEIDDNGRITAKKEGKADITVSIAGGFSDTCTIQVSAAQDISKAVISEIPNQIFTGSASEPVITVYLGDKLLTENVDYFMTYQNNKTPGTASVTITGTGNYTGKAEKNFNIICRHEERSEEVVYEPTYTTTGLKKYTCIICGDAYTEIIPVLPDEIPPEGRITVDKNFWKELLSTITFGIYTNSSLDVSIDAEDKESGVDKIEYLISEEFIDENALREAEGWNNYTGRFNVSPKEYQNCVIYARIQDYGGNQIYLSTDGFVFDTELPQITGATDGGIYCKEVDITVQDDNLDRIYLNGIDKGENTSLHIEDAGNYTLTAKDKSGNEAEISFKINGSHRAGEWITDKEATVYGPGKKHIECTICHEILYEEIIPMLEVPFNDVDKFSWSFESIMYCYTNQWISGKTEDTFDPFSSVTRAEMVTILGRYADIDASEYAGRSDFEDVSKGEWFEPYIAWASANGITSGIDKSHFGPNQELTRYETAVFLVRMAAYMEKTLPIVRDNPEFKDEESIPEWAIDSVYALYRAGIVNGNAGGTYDGEKSVTREETAAFIANFDKAFLNE